LHDGWYSSAIGGDAFQTDKPQNFTNSEVYPFVFSTACYTASIDSSGPSLGEAFVANEFGASVYVGHSASIGGEMNISFQNLLSKNFSRSDILTVGELVESTRDILPVGYKYLPSIIGDPAIKFKRTSFSYVPKDSQTVNCDSYSEWEEKSYFYSLEKEYRIYDNKLYSHNGWTSDKSPDVNVGWDIEGTCGDVDQIVNFEKFGIDQDVFESVSSDAWKLSGFYQYDIYNSIGMVILTGELDDTRLTLIDKSTLGLNSGYYHMRLVGNRKSLITQFWLK
jgi:hypothetical protein